MIRILARVLLLAAGGACGMATPLAHAQVACGQEFQVFTVFLPGGGTTSFTGLNPGVFVDYAPGAKVDLGIYCEGIGAFPPPVIAGATYGWSTGATTQRIEVTAPAAGVTAAYSATVTSPSGTKTVGLSLRGAAAGVPICTVESTAAQPMKPGVPFSLRAVCSPTPTTYTWDPRLFTGKIEFVAGADTATPSFMVTNAQPGEVLPIYLTAKIGAATGPYASALVTAGNPDVAVATAGISAGTNHTCANTTTGGAKCWGNNNGGQLGAGRSIFSSTAPLNVIGNAANTAAVTSGSLHACARTLQDNARCWGDNSRGQLGDDNAAFAYFGVNVVNLGSVTSVSSGPGSLHTCAVTITGTVKCWGANESGQLGNGGVADSRVAVNATGFPLGIAKVATGLGHTCVVTNGGAARCLGNNAYGQLGDGTTTNRTASVAVSGLVGVLDIAVGAQHTCALLVGGSVRCWGRNQFGELGNGSTGGFSAIPVAVGGLTGVTRISAGESHACAVASGSGRCWGRNTEGQLGDGTLINKPAPVQVTGLASGVTAVSAGGFHTCAQLTGDTVACWGRNLVGQLGDGTYAFKGRPSPVAAAANSAGQLDANNWYLRLDPLGSGTVPVALVPKALAEAFRSATGRLGATVRYKVADAGKVLDNFVVAFVPPEFLAEVKTAPGTPSLAELKASAKAGLVYVQLTPLGWTGVGNELIAFTRGTTAASSGALNILDNTPVAALPPGTRFCVGYGEGSGDALASQTFVEVSNVEGAITEADGRPCVLSGVYLHGPPRSLAGTAVTFGASVVGTSPTGTLQFRDGSANLGDPKLIALQAQGVATASVSTSALAAGTHSIGAIYSGDSQNTWAQDAPVTPLLHVVGGLSSVSISGEASSKAGEDTTFTATITGNNPSGLVQFLVGGANLGAAQPVRDATALLTTSALGVGSHTITAAYQGDPGNLPSTSAGLAHRVDLAINTTIALASSLNPSTGGQPVTITATVTGASPTGSVRFRDADSTLATVALLNGQAAVTVATFAPGLHEIWADYLGDANDAPVSGSLFQQVTAPVVLASTHTTLASPSNPSTLAQAITLTATVSGSPAPASGTVAFRSDGVLVAGCEAVPLAGGAAACSTMALPQGDRIVTAEYGGDTSHAASTSLAVKQTVNAGAVLLAVGPATVSFGGQSVNTTSAPVTVTITNSSLASVAITSVTASPRFLAGANCATLAPGATCQATVRFTPATAGAVGGLLAVTHAGGGPAAVLLTGTGERSLTTHYYQSILRRAPDAGGKTFWEGEAARVSTLGASVNETWFSMAQQFYGSGEYTAFNRDNTGFATDLYNTFFNRTPDSGGLAFWAGQLDQGLPRGVALASFMFSPEFSAFAQATFGNTSARAEVNAVVDFYRGLLGRLPDSGGFTYWVGRFRAAQCQGAAAITNEVEGISSAFALSGEYAARGRTNAQYVGDLYNAFLRRGGELSGVQYWISQIDSVAQTREQVRLQFRGSSEFLMRVSAIIAQGCLS